MVNSDISLMEFDAMNAHMSIAMYISHGTLTKSSVRQEETLEEAVKGR